MAETEVQKDLLGNPIPLSEKSHGHRGQQVPGQRRLPKAARIDATISQPVRTETRKLHPYWVSEGIAMLSGPYGGDTTDALGYTPSRALVKPLYKDSHSPSFFVEVIKPTKLRGKRFWIGKRPGEKGWAKSIFAIFLPIFLFSLKFQV